MVQKDLQDSPLQVRGMDDPYQWLEEVNSVPCTNWVQARNEETRGHLGSLPQFARLHEDIGSVLAESVKFPEVNVHDGWIYNVCQTRQNPRGIWRRCTLDEYRKKNTSWDLLIDLDELSRLEKEPWFLNSAEILSEGNRALVSLSRAGKDACVIREFDLHSKVFVEHGFRLPEAKSSVWWLDFDRIVLSTDLGGDSLTIAGYPRELRILRRGERPSESVSLFSVGRESNGVLIDFDQTGGREIERALYSDWVSFYGERLFRRGRNGEFVELPIPQGAQARCFVAGLLFLSLRTASLFLGRTLSPGTLLALPFDSQSFDEATIVFEPDENQSLQDVQVSGDRIYLNVLNDLRAQIFAVGFAGKSLQKTELKLPIPDFCRIDFLPSGAGSKFFLIKVEGFLTPPCVYGVEGERFELLKTSKPRFSVENLKVEQRFATSPDGTQIPYFVVARGDLVLNGENPTLLYGYGGFELSILPSYSPAMGKAWLERGGVYVVGNIRGGLEYGPRWHRAALSHQRQRSYDDFIAVAEDLISRRLTSPARLAINGRSNGGLLMGVMYTQRPDLFAAVVCEVPLLDMLRYHKLLAGASWRAEYGDPDVLQDRKTLERYSPYHNFSVGRSYPEIFLMTSTRDDRVHPGHARKMAALLEENGQPYHYYENNEGGHSGANNPLEATERLSLMYTFLWDIFSRVRAGQSSCSLSGER